MATNYIVKLTVGVRTLTVNDVLQFNSIDTANLVSTCNAAATATLAFVTSQSLTLKSLQGHFSFTAVAGRTLGGQATYSTGYDLATPSLLQRAIPNAVEPEHRIAFALSPVDATNATTLSAAYQNVILQGLYDAQLYKH